GTPKRGCRKRFLFLASTSAASRPGIHSLFLPMASFAGRPTNEPATFYQSGPQSHLRPQDPTRLGAAEDHASNRHSGIDALGMGFMNANLDDSDDEDDEDMRSPVSSPSKHAALAAATGVKTPSKGTFAPPERFETPPPMYNHNSPSPIRVPSPQEIAAPRPGYAAPMAVLNQSANSSVARPQPSAVPAGRAPPPGNLRIVPPGSPMGSPYGTPSPSASPHPLQAPVTPITPVFARPQRTVTMSSDNGSVAFSDTKGLIMRGDREETPLRPRGEKGDQFWRRFSMVAKDSDEKRPSEWLSKTQAGGNRMSRWVWVIGFILLICAIGGIAAGVYVSENGASHQRPDAIGGSANDGTESASSTASGHKSGSTAKGALGTSTGLHVSPTNTVARRANQARGTPLAKHAARSRHSSNDFAH
ncbi:hypothetical protein FB45DRAFT_284601, partial [Roridomyces roridus]